jgi:hypothetical protein
VAHGTEIEKPMIDAVGGCEFLHQLISGKHPIIYRVSTILLVMQNFAGPSPVPLMNPG